VDDVKAATAKARTEVPGMGSFSIFVDPTGASLGLWQAARK
jgi:predicted enzyme related to lactoylglutathione lyase